MGETHGLYFAFVLCLFVQCFGSYTKQHIRSQFELDFHNRCDKYPFVQNYYDKLENPPDKYIIFVYHEKSFRNGGIGDRFGGLISAVAMSLRFNRTFLIKASNGFHQMFRPHHPIDVKSAEPRFLWNKWSEWTNYKPVQDLITSLGDDDDERDEIEYNMEDCVSNQEEGFTPEQTFRCSLDTGDVPQQVIKFKSNRAYLCRWLNHQEYASHDEFMRVLFGSGGKLNSNSDAAITSTANVNNIASSPGSLGFDPTADLFEVAGCMMRLALWPTDALWDRVDTIYDEYHQGLIQKYNQSAATTATSLSGPGAKSDKKKKKKKDKKSKKSKKSKSKKSKKSSTEDNEIDSDSPDTTITTTAMAAEATTEASLAVTGTTTSNTTITPVLQQPVFQIGMHMRCGDRFSYFNLKLHTDGYDRFACIIEQPNIEGRESSTKHEKSIYLNAGNPITIGMCGKSVYNEYANDLQKTNRKRQKALKQSAEMSVDGSSVIPAGGDTPVAAVIATDPLRSSFVYITSDNILSAEQMNRTMGHPHTFISPQGCHIELDPSVECHLFTVGYWFMLSLSDVVISQTFGDFNAPTSSFSRYAGVYGLKTNPFRSGRYCHERHGTNAVISHIEQGNWFCR